MPSAPIEVHLPHVTLSPAHPFLEAVSYRSIEDEFKDGLAYELQWFIAMQLLEEECPRDPRLFKTQAVDIVSIPTRSLPPTPPLTRIALEIDFEMVWASILDAVAGQWFSLYAH
ncbi:hypothetical protein B0H19DRAFT_1266991 [Mycena capillaripes]|nr:hypothetical protein B0H19DRAFT_1266991 [Mycena capillaripes]